MVSMATAWPYLESHVARGVSKRNQRAARPPQSSIERMDEFDQCCVQAIAIASLLMDAEIEPAVQDSAWAIRSLVERAMAINNSLFSGSPTRTEK